jgi:hypothetical protein
MLRSSAIAFPVLSFMTACELHRLRPGAADRATLWAPPVLIYKLIGYWPTVLSVPLLGIGCCKIFIGKLRRVSKLEKKDRQRAAGSAATGEMLNDPERGD